MGFFGAGSTGNSAVGGLMGGVGGFLQTGSLLGGAAGALGGMFGGDQTQTTSFNYAELSEDEKEAKRAALRASSDAFAQLDPAQLDAYVAQLYDQAGGVARTNVMDQFSDQRGQQSAAAARSGGLLGSVQNLENTAMAKSQGKALNEADLGARMYADNAGVQRGNLYTGIATGGVNAATSLENSRKLLSQTGTVQGNNMMDSLSGLMGSFSDPMSAYNLGTGGFGEGGWMSNIPGMGDPGGTLDLLGTLKQYA